MEQSPIENLPFYRIAEEKHLNILTTEDLTAMGNGESFQADPWGWNLSLHNLLQSFGDIFYQLPSEDRIKKIRNLSHRRTTIAFLKECESLLPKDFVFPQETASVEEIKSIFETEKDLFLKYPWSSSGRGIIRTHDLEWRHIEPWTRGGIRSQGSVIVEKTYRRKLDFATEWEIREDRSVKFLGLSVFQTSPRGKYLSNAKGSQDELEALVNEASPLWNHDVIGVLREGIEKVIAPDYTGLLGIDMLVTEAGEIHPCVEINLRHTMGMIGLI